MELAAGELFQLGPIARKFGVSTDAIRQYGRIGVYPEKRLLGQRVLTQADVEAIAAHRRALADRRKGRPAAAAERQPTSPRAQRVKQGAARKSAPRHGAAGDAEARG
jgi:DNA-binding transcriptional MerR regulator